MSGRWGGCDAPMLHPKLDQPLIIDRLVELANPERHFRDGLKGAAAKVLNNSLNIVFAYSL